MTININNIGLRAGIDRFVLKENGKIVAEGMYGHRAQQASVTWNITQPVNGLQIVSTAWESVAAILAANPNLTVEYVDRRGRPLEDASSK